MEVDNGLLPTGDCPLPCLFQGVYVLDPDEDPFRPSKPPRLDKHAWLGARSGCFAAQKSGAGGSLPTFPGCLLTLDLASDSCAMEDARGGCQSRRGGTSGLVQSVTHAASGPESRLHVNLGLFGINTHV